MAGTAPTRQLSDPAFWSQWVLANLLGELIGLGVVAGVTYAALTRLGEPTSVVSSLAYAALTVALGAVEGAVVGLAQARVLRRRLPRLRSWVAATIIGAVIAWTLGVLPGTLASLLGPGQSEPPADMPDAIQLLLAVPVGVLAGAILSLPQWRILRRYVSGAGWWVAANAIAWAFGMPFVFVAASIDPTAGAGSALTLIGGSLAAAGAVVGAIHGAFLVRLLEGGDHAQRPV